MSKLQHPPVTGPNATPEGRRGFLRVAAASAGLATLGSGLLSACGGGGDEPTAATSGGMSQAQGSKPTNVMDTPIVTCLASTSSTITLRVCGGVTTGAPAGFSVQWMSCADYEAAGKVWPSDETKFCKASFSGNANDTQWNLHPGGDGCATVEIGKLNDADPGVSFTCNDPLDCDGCYVFRVFAHASSTYKRSAFIIVSCGTGPCQDHGLKDGDFCTKSQGFFGGKGGPGLAALQCYFATYPSLSIGSGANVYTWQLAGADFYTPGTGKNATLVAGANLIDDGIDALQMAVGGGGQSGQLSGSATNPLNMGSGGGLASQTAALSLNVALSGSGCTAGTCNNTGYPKGYGDVKLCKFDTTSTLTNSGTPISQATADWLNLQTVSSVLAAANTYLGGGALPPGMTAADLNELVADLNLAFDLTDWNGDGIADCACGGMTSFAEQHLCGA